MVYTIGIKRKFWFGFTKYLVKGHRTQFELQNHKLDKPRLILTLEDGSELALADVMNRDFILYSDFKDVQRKMEDERERAEWRKQTEAEQEEFKKYLAAKAATPVSLVKEA